MGEDREAIAKNVFNLVVLNSTMNVTMTIQKRARKNKIWLKIV